MDSDSEWRKRGVEFKLVDEAMIPSVIELLNDSFFPDEPMFRCLYIGILTIGITERFKVLGHEPGQHLLAERHIRQGLEGRLQCGRCQQGGEVDGGACGQGYQVNDYCSTKIFLATLTVWNKLKLTNLGDLTVVWWLIGVCAGAKIWEN